MGNSFTNLTHTMTKIFDPIGYEPVMHLKIWSLLILNTASTARRKR